MPGYLFASLYYCKKVKIKLSPLQAMNAHGRCGCKGPLIRSHGSRMPYPRPSLPPRKPWCSFYRRLSEFQGLYGHEGVEKVSTPPPPPPQGRPALRQAPSRLSYLTPTMAVSMAPTLLLLLILLLHLLPLLLLLLLLLLYLRPIFFFFVYLPSPNLGLKTQMPVGQMPVGRATVFGPEH